MTRFVLAFSALVFLPLLGCGDAQKVSALEKENAALKQEVAGLKKQVGQLSDQLKAKDAAAAKAQEEVARLAAIPRDLPMDAVLFSVFGGRAIDIQKVSPGEVGVDLVSQEESAWRLTKGDKRLHGVGRLTAKDSGPLMGSKIHSYALSMSFKVFDIRKRKMIASINQTFQAPGINAEKALMEHVRLAKSGKKKQSILSAVDELAADLPF